ncbi:Phospholipid methyltransferase [Candidatus Gugararchaeum adminiculabundum]|nr:Phospholipid methyltransferase [Candidatus Gugararchaeum adminiculabundum]
MANLALLKKIVLAFTLVPIILALMFFLPAGTLDYWQAWAYCAVLFIPMIFVIAYFLKYDQALLERRMMYKEKEAKQKSIIKMSYIFFIFGFLLPGFDHRYGWSHIPPEISIAADVFIFLGYMLIFLTFKENSYASRIIQVEKNQKVISTGPYAIVRHPMYVGALAMWVLSPIALGSLIAFILFLPVIAIIILRIFNEEDLLRKQLPGYNEYCQKVRYRLIPFVW